MHWWTFCNFSSFYSEKYKTLQHVQVGSRSENFSWSMSETLPEFKLFLMRKYRKGKINVQTYDARDQE